jgi:16S rRNA (uracil1498-N3)-methyltransferase
MRDYKHFLFYASQISKSSLTLDNDESCHAVKVLRLKTGDLFQATNGDGVIRICKLDTVGKHQTTASILECLPGQTQPIQIRCFIGLPERDAFESIIADFTALGVDRISPVICEYSQQSWWEQKWDKLLSRFSSKMVSAMKQSLYPQLPTLDTPIPFATALTESKGQTFFADFDGKPINAFCSSIESSVNCFIGPPGGFSQMELDSFNKSNFHSVKIAFTRLRTELAAVVLCGQILNGRL